MNSSNNNNEQRPEIGKTFVEGDGANTGVYSLRNTNVRLDATSVRGANPYGQQAESSNLPSGNEPLVLGSGTIVGLLGTGGMARVYKIWNEKLEVFRAVKILIPTQQGDLRNRFETEAKITAKLHHPNIVEIYNVGDWQNLPYLEMELIDGKSLEAIIHATGKLPAQVCSAISIFVIRALAYAHGQEFLIYGKTYQGIIHRDLKPANIMISSQGALKLMDFGIARPTEASLHTVEGNIVGTMQYLSPEQLDGIDVDHRADLYAFGAILYEMLTGTKTFPQETITNLMKQKIVNEYRKFDDFDFSIPSGLAKIAQKCLQLAKESRFANAVALLKELESVHKSLTEDSPEAILKAFTTDPESIPGAKREKFSIRINFKILLSIAGVIAIGLLISLFIITGPKPTQHQTPQSVTATPAVQAPVAQNPTANIEAPGAAQSMQPLGNSAAPAPQNQPMEQQVQSSRYQSAGRLTQIREKTPTRPLSAQKKHITGPAPLPSSEPAEISPLEKLKKTYASDDYFTIGKLALGKDEFADAIAALSAVPKSDPNSDKAALMLAEAYLETGRYQNAQSVLQRETINDAEYFFLCGKLAQKQGRNDEAINHFQTALTKPCMVRNIGEVRNDALYYTAVARQTMYETDPTPDSKGMALQSWLVVKNIYRNNPNHARYKKATEEMGSIK